jgi:multiple sugar transport system permease protein
MATLQATESNRRSLPIVSYLARKNRGWLLLGYVVIAVFAIWTIIPIYWELLTSFKTEAEINTIEVVLFPREFTFYHYVEVFTASKFPLFFRNSFVVAFSTMIVAMVVGSMGGYAMTRLRFFGRTTFARLLIYSYLAPGSVLFIPLYAMFVKLNLINNLAGVSIAYLTFTVPFCTWMLMGYFRSIPVELEEAALVDGATRWIALWRIIVPLAAPALVVVAVFSFTLSWNEFIFALVLLQKEELLTAPVGLTYFTIGDTTYWGAMMAASSLMMLLPVALYFFAQRWVVRGWTLGAFKS